MSEWLCYNCIYCEGQEDNWLICNRIWSCYVQPKTKCNYFKAINRGDNL